jgi:TonB family protein
MTERNVVVYLVNALWMAPLLAGVAWLGAWMARWVSARWEHRVWVGALAAGEERESYARSLLRLAAMVAPVRENIHAIGIFDANGFERRVMRLITGTKEVSGMRRWLIVAACGVLVLGTGASAVALRVGVGEEKSESKAPKKVMVSQSNLTLVKKVNPVYPPDAKKARIQGAVVLAGVIGKSGVVEHLSVKSGPKELQQSALDAVRQWTYEPYLLNGDPVEVETEITVTYALAG